MKDPIAVFSSKWLAETFDMQVVVTIRHPIAFVASLKKANNWYFDYHNFINQPLLMEKYLTPWQDKIEEYAKRKPSRVEHGILFWNMVHSVLHQYQQEHPDWIFIRHEDLSVNPQEEFSQLFSQLNIDYSDRIDEKIKLATSSSVENDQDISLMELKRNSLNNLLSFKERLDKDEIQQINKETKQISQLFYPEDKWHDFYQNS